MTNPYVFIVGCPRSGTTLLQRVVDAHPQIAITPESHWIPRCFEKRRGLTPEGLVTPELIPRLLEDRRFADLHIGREELEALMGTGQPVSYSSFVTGIFDLYGKGQGKALVGDKTPGYVRWLRTLHALWPQARFVHLIRDGREVCLSTVNWPRAHQWKRPGAFATWKGDPVSTSALWWEWNVRLGRQAGHSLGPDLYYEIRYESLVNHPAEACAALCAFLGLPYGSARCSPRIPHIVARYLIRCRWPYFPVRPTEQDSEPGRNEPQARGEERAWALEQAVDAVGPLQFPRDCSGVISGGIQG